MSFLCCGLTTADSSVGATVNNLHMHFCHIPFLPANSLYSHLVCPAIPTAVCWNMEAHLKKNGNIVDATKSM